MLKMRLQRVGRKHEPSFRLLLTDSENSTKSGRFKEILGSYDPRGNSELLKEDRIKYWLANGAVPTDTVHNLLVSKKVIIGKKVNVSAKSKKEPVAAAEPAATSESAAPAQESTPVAEASPAPEAPAPVEESPAPEPPAPAQEGGIIETAEEKAA